MTPFLSAENEIKLRQAIADAGLTSVEELIVSNAVECATMLTIEPDDYSQVGNSRYGGLPDLPVDFEWPCDSYGRCFSFEIQINLSEVPPFVGKWLPESGMLYFFWDDATPRLCYSESAELTKTLPPDYKGPDAANGTPIIPQDRWYATIKPHRLAIHAAIDLPEWSSEAHSTIVDALIESGDEDGEDRYSALVRAFVRRGEMSYDESWAGKLQGSPCWIGYVPDGDEGEDPENQPDELFFALLNSNTSVGMIFGDAGYVLLYVPRAEAEARTFNGVTMETESS